MELGRLQLAVEVWWMLLALLIRAAEACDEAQLVSIVVFAVILHIAARRLEPGSAATQSASAWSVVLMLLYFYYRSVTFPGSHLDNAGRSLLVGWLAYGPVLIFRWLLRECLVQFVRLAARIRLASHRTGARFAAAYQIAQQRGANQDSIEPAETERPLTVRDVKQLHQRQCNLIRTAGLAPEEEESLLLHARQQYIRQLREIIE